MNITFTIPGPLVWAVCVVAVALLCVSLLVNWPRKKPADVPRETAPPVKSPSRYVVDRAAILRLMDNQPSKFKVLTDWETLARVRRSLDLPETWKLTIPDWEAVGALLIAFVKHYSTRRDQLTFEELQFVADQYVAVIELVNELKKKKKGAP